MVKVIVIGNTDIVQYGLADVPVETLHGVEDRPALTVTVNGRLYQLLDQSSGICMEMESGDFVMLKHDAFCLEWVM